MARKKIEKTGIEQAVEKTGSQAALARELGVTQQAVSVWLKQGYVPAGRAREIEMLCGVPRAKLASPKVMSIMDGEVVL